jgi:hypothetical protein
MGPSEALVYNAPVQNRQTTISAIYRIAPYIPLTGLALFSNVMLILVGGYEPIAAMFERKGTSTAHAPQAQLH